ncbi:family 78 glycoside hydrolase catalytic domain [Undibacterium sp. Di26W]|uniref:family 78 glycoside hydrolase catalytic domain n=1 Tax=Undibacterium sp. Di26W TaxID=3413035 RepID=UPI003BEF5656
MTLYRQSFFIGALLLLASAVSNVRAQATWIWYPGDFEIWLSNQMQVKRIERDAYFMPFWRLYGHQPQLNFTREVNLPVAEDITVHVEGRHAATIDGRLVQGDQHHIHVPAGKHRLNFQVFNPVTPPAIFVQGPSIQSDDSWLVGPRPNARSSELGAVYAARWNFDSEDRRPSQFKLSTQEIMPASLKPGVQSLLVDFGQETIGFVKLKQLKGSGKLSFHYGETLEEAMATETGETLDRFSVNGRDGEFVAPESRALRYVNIQFGDGMSVDGVSLLYEYLPLTRHGSFRSSDEELNRIWDVSLRSLELNTREFFLDGIKRDHWVWAGDAVQTYLMNYYTFFDNEAVKRTTWALRGADPVDMHVNTILDYSLYWFIGIRDYYQYTGDAAFLKSVYPRMVTLMDFVLKRRNANGMLEGRPGDWVFVDWAKMPKDGELSVIQLLFARSLESMADCADIAQDREHAAQYRQLAYELKDKIKATFWDTEKQAFIHSHQNGKLNRLVTRHPNMLALTLGYLDEDQAAAVKHNVLLNDNVPAITTPYMRFYELAALAQSGQHDYVIRQIKDYWGGMLRDGATCFWEEYDPKQTGIERYAMYGKAFGKSLCHAWGASPLYLLGKYYLGVTPTQPGYAEYLVAPHLGGLKWIEGKVPTPYGDITVAVNEKRISIVSMGGKGSLRFISSSKPHSDSGIVRSLGGDLFELFLEHAGKYVVDYTASAHQ